MTRGVEISKFGNFKFLINGINFYAQPGKRDPIGALIHQGKTFKFNTITISFHLDP